MILISIFINNLKDEIEIVLVKFANGVKEKVSAANISEKD